MHLILVKEIGKITLERPKPKQAPAPAAPAPEAAPAQQPGGMPGAMPGGYPGMPGYPEMGGWPGGYPQMPAGYPGMPGYPQMPGGYPGQPGGYPGQPAPGAYPSNVRPLTLEELTGGPGSGAGGSMNLLYGVNLEVTVEIGRNRVPIRDVLAWTPGSLVELDKLAGDKVDVLVNGHLIASGEVVVVEENFGVRITDVSARARRLAMGEGAA
jgi:flagellar motor switch protein FliN